MQAKNKNAKKVISLLLTVCLMLSLFSCISGITAFANDTSALKEGVSVPVEVESGGTASAATANAASSEKPAGDKTHASHCYCGGEFEGKLGHTCTDGVVWQELAATATNLPSSGNYYLSGNLSISDTGSYQVTGDLHICFNGYTITFTKPRSYIFWMPASNTSEVHVSFCDCDSDYEGGMIEHNCNSKISGVILTTREIMSGKGTNEFYNTVDVFGGIYDSTGSYCASGGTFCAGGNSVINIYDCIIKRDDTTTVANKDNATVPDCSLGGAICAIEASKVNIMGGTFEGCIATNTAKSSGYGGVVCARGTSVVTISGGEYYNCSAVKDGAIAATQNTATVKVSGKLKVRDCGDKSKLFYKSANGTLINEAVIDDGIKPSGDTDHASHCYCGGAFEGKHGHTCTDGVVWQELPASTTTLPTSGNYYLSGNINITDTNKIEISGDLHICFNGYTITFPKRSYVYQCSETATQNFNISFCDCDPDYEGGMIQHLNSSNVSGVILTSRNKNSVNTIDVFGGVFDTTGSFSASGSVFCVGGSNVLNIYGGNIKSNGIAAVPGVSDTAPDCKLGGAICAIETSKLNIMGGTFEGCTSTSKDRVSGYGGVACARNSAVITISGGTFTNCSAVTGGAIAATQNNGKIIVNGKIETKGCSAVNGGLFYNCSAGTLLFENGACVSGGSASLGGVVYNEGVLRISGNIANSDSYEKFTSGTLIADGTAIKGGCIYHKGTEFTISGGTVSGGIGGTSSTDGYAASNGGGNIYIGESGKTCNMTGGAIKNGTAYSAGGNVYLIKGATFNMTGGSIENGYSEYVSGTSYSGGNVYVGGTFTMDDTDKGDTVYPVVSGGSANKTGGGNFSINELGARLYIKGGVVKNGSATYTGRGNIYGWYRVEKDAVVISGGTVTNDDNIELKQGYGLGGIGFNISADYIHNVCIKGDAQVLDEINLQRKAESGASTATITVSDGFSGKVKMVKLVDSGFNMIELGEGETYDLGSGWDSEEYLTSGKVHFSYCYKASYKDGTVTIEKSDYLKKFEEISKYAVEGFKLNQKDEIGNIASSFKSYFTPEVAADLAKLNSELFIKNLEKKVAQYDDMLNVHIEFTDNFGENGDKVLLTVYSCLDGEGIDAGNGEDKKDYGYDFARIILKLNGKTYGEDEPVTDVYKWVECKGINLADADAKTLYDYVYFKNIVIDKSEFSGEGVLKAQACVTTVDGKETYGEEKEIKLKDIYPVNKYEAGQERYGNGATNAEAEILEKAYEGRNPYHGDMHDHSNSGGTSDGKVALAEWPDKVAALDLDFACILDHKQVLHMYSEYWPDNFIGGSEAGAPSIDGAKLHYNMVFAEPEGLMSVLEQFPEFKFTGGPDGHFGYPSFTRERFEELAIAIREAGGYLVMPHPSDTASHILPDDDADWFYYGDYNGIEVLYWGVDSKYIKRNYEIYRELLSEGKRVYACAGGDYHNEPRADAITTLYATDNKAAPLVSVARTGDTTAGGVGIRMIMGDTVTGGHKVFTDGEKLIIGVGDFHKSLISSYGFFIKIFAGDDVIAEERIDINGINYFEIPVDSSVPYYRAEVYRTDKNGTVVAYGNPIWNDAE